MRTQMVRARTICVRLRLHHVFPFVWDRAAGNLPPRRLQWHPVVGRGYPAGQHVEAASHNVDVDVLRVAAAAGAPPAAPPAALPGTAPAPAVPGGQWLCQPADRHRQ
jgi:hypothetical protein